MTKQQYTQWFNIWSHSFIKERVVIFFEFNAFLSKTTVNQVDHIRGEFYTLKSLRERYYVLNLLNELVSKEIRS